MSPKYNIDLKRWSEMNIFEQMGNIGSEVGRSFAAMRRVDKNSQSLAMERAIDLFDLTIYQLISEKSVKTKEVMRAKENFLGTMFNSSSNNSDFDSLEKYFTQFAIAARLNK